MAILGKVSFAISIVDLEIVSLVDTGFCANKQFEKHNNAKIATNDFSKIQSVFLVYSYDIYHKIGNFLIVFLFISKI